jgi:8-oxo-dGTP pyrophosphatase MutT (NUDIX family)
MTAPDRRADLRALIAAYQPADGLEAAHRDRMLALAEAPGDPFARDHFEPGHFTASAFVLSPARDALLLILHGKLHRWLQPGGHIDPADPDVFSAARREVSEETGMTRFADTPPRLFDLDVHDIPPSPKRGEPGHAHFDVRILLHAVDLEFAPGSDARDARWVPIGEVESIETDESVMRAVRRIRRHHPGPG